MVPIRRPLATRIVSVAHGPLLLIDLHTEEGITGRTYLFGYFAEGPNLIAPVVKHIIEACQGDEIVPDDIYRKARQRLTMIGHQGLSLMAISGVDMACWDALAHAADLPLCRLLAERMGVEPKSVPAYNSNGLGIIEPVAAAEEALALLAEGNFSAVKVRLGRDTLEEDLAVVRAVRQAVGDDVVLPTDFNQCLSADEAIRRGQALDGEGIYWIEEPIAYDDWAGNARVTREIATPIQIGENFYGPEDVRRAIDEKSCDLVMPDVERIGGVTGWLRSAQIAEEAGLKMSSHLFPEVSSHLLSVTPTAHWMEFMDWGAPVLEHPMEIKDGFAVIPHTSGSGMTWNEDNIAKYEFEL